MKPASFLIVLIFNWIIWTFVKTIHIRKSLARQVEKDNTANDVNKILIDEAESSMNPQIQKYKETLNPKLKITKKDKDKGADKVLDKSEYHKQYYQKNKEKLREYSRNSYEKNKKNLLKIKERQEYYRNYLKQNKERINENQRNYYKRKKEKIRKSQKKYEQNNRKNGNENKRKWRQKKKNVQSENIEGTSFVNPQTDDFTNLVKLSIVCEEEGNLLKKGEEECNNSEDEQNQIEVEEPNKILEDETNQVDLNKNIHPFDLNEMPDGDEIEDN